VRIWPQSERAGGRRLLRRTKPQTPSHGVVVFDLIQWGIPRL
jgi:hypothetical protein